MTVQAVLATDENASEIPPPALRSVINRDKRLATIKRLRAEQHRAHVMLACFVVMLTVAIVILALWVGLI